MFTKWFNDKQKALAKYYDNFIGVKPICVSQKDIVAWFSTGRGKAVLSREQACLDKLLPEIFGYHLMQLSVLPDICLFNTSPTSHQFTIQPFEKNSVLAQPVNGSSVVAEFESLPVAAESVDVVVLHHALDFSFNPHQLLRESTRVIIPNGYVVLVGFNPLSLIGLMSRVACLFSGSHFYRHHYLRVGRLKDWFKVLELDLLYSHFGSYGFSKTHRYSETIEKFGKTCWPMFGGFYVIVLRKNVTPITTVKMKWKRKKALPSWGKGIVGSSASSSKHQSIPHGNRNNEKG
jgi:SAM-dependent methyltransferase